MCRWMLSWVLLTSLVTAISEEQQYCAVRYRRLCQGKGHHVACQFPDAGPGPSCERYTPIKFTNDLQHFITHYLNRRRQRIAAGNERVRGGVHLPKPQVMMLVEWDRELALLAQRLADQCYFVHDDCRATVRYPYAGQTVGEVRWRRSSDSDELSAQRAIRRVLDAWWGERRRVQSKQLTAPFRLTSKGNVWGHFSQLAVWNLQAVGCGAVRHGARPPRLLLVCDFSHTNMLGQRTLVPGSIAPCPIHTVRKARTAYPHLCAPVRHPVPSGSQEIAIEDHYEEYEEDDNAITTTDVADLSSSEHQSSSSSDRRWFSPLVKSKTIREFTDVPKNIDNEIYREFAMAPTTLIEAVVLKLDQNLEEKTRSKVHNMNVNYKEAHNTFEINQFENILKNDWKARQKPNVGQWRDNNRQENLEEVIPLTIPTREITETVDPTAAEVYRPKEDEPCSAEEVYRPTIREGSAHDESYFRPRWRQTRIRPQRPGANALLISTSTATLATATKKEFLVSLNLDKEDIDQLFRDTGFNVHWRKQTT